MRRSRFNEEQIIGILREHNAGGTADVCCKHGISSATFFKWRSKYGGMDVSEARRLKMLTDKNAKRKRLLAGAMLDNATLKELNSKKMVTPVAKRQAVAHLGQMFEVSQPRACQMIDADRRRRARYRPQALDARTYAPNGL
jgi:putative transposase